MAIALLYLVVGLAVVAGIAYWILLARSAATGGIGLTLIDRVERVLAPHEGQSLSAAALAELQRDVEAAVRDGLVDYGCTDVDYAVVLRNDDLLGPVCLIRISDGREVPLSAFERSLRRPAGDVAA